MTSLMQRIDTLASANLDYLASLTLKEKSLAILEEYIRQVREGLRALEEVVATVGAAISSYQQKERQYQARQEDLDQAIDLFLQRDHLELALEAASRYNTATSLVEMYQERAAREQTEYQKLVEARAQIRARLAEAQRDRDQLRLLLDGSSDEGEAVEASTQSQVVRAMQQRLDQATDQGRIGIDQLEQELGQVLETGLVQDQLSARKRRLNL